VDGARSRAMLRNTRLEFEITPAAHQELKAFRLKFFGEIYDGISIPIYVAKFQRHGDSCGNMKFGGVYNPDLAAFHVLCSGRLVGAENEFDR